MSTTVIVNPRSAAGRTGARLDALRTMVREVLGTEAILAATERSGHASELAAQAARDGCERVIAVGGDGTASEVVHGLMLAREEGLELPAFGLLTAGTGCDTVRTLGVPRDWQGALEVIASTEARPTDTIAASFTAPDGSTVRRWGLNECSFGMSGEVVDRVNHASKRLGGFATFLRVTITTAVSYEAPMVRIRYTLQDGEQCAWEGPLAVCFVNNGRYSGGGMRTGGSAVMNDGLLRLVIAPQSPLYRTIRRLPRLYDGQVEALDDVVSADVTHVEAEVLSGPDSKCDLDGEMPGMLPVSVSVVPSALRVHGTWPGV